jgi:hypothetical protein
MNPAWFTVPVTLQPNFAPVTVWKKHEPLALPANIEPGTVTPESTN